MLPRSNQKSCLDPLRGFPHEEKLPSIAKQSKACLGHLFGSLPYTIPFYSLSSSYQLVSIVVPAPNTDFLDSYGEDGNSGVHLLDRNRSSI